jgi:hypothetical protein
MTGDVTYTSSLNSAAVSPHYELKLNEEGIKPMRTRSCRETTETPATWRIVLPGSRYNHPPAHPPTKDARYCKLFYLTDSTNTD